MYDAETIMIKQKKSQKTNTEHLKSLSENRGKTFFYQHNTSQETTGSDLHHITSRFFHFTQYFCLQREQLHRALLQSLLDI